MLKKRCFPSAAGRNCHWLCSGCSCIPHLYTDPAQLFKTDALEINETFRTHNSVTVSRGDLSFQAPAEKRTNTTICFLLDRNTAVFSGKAVPETDDTILLDFWFRKIVIYRHRRRARDRPVLENFRKGKTLHCAKPDDFYADEPLFL